MSADVDSMPLNLDEDLFETRIIYGDDGVTFSVHYSPLDITVLIGTKSIERATYIAKTKIIEHICSLKTQDISVASDAELSRALESNNTNDVLVAIVVGKLYDIDISAVYSNSRALRSKPVQWALYEKEMHERVTVFYGRRKIGLL